MEYYIDNWVLKIEHIIEDLSLHYNLKASCAAGNTQNLGNFKVRP